MLDHSLRARYDIVMPPLVLRSCAENVSVVMSVPHTGLEDGENDALEGIFSARTMPGVQNDGDQRLWMSIGRHLPAFCDLHVVRNLVPRPQLDPNRPPEGAYQDAQFAAPYVMYHGQVINFLAEIQQNGHAPLLVDLHGFGEQPPYGEYDVIIGTHNGRTVQSDADQAIADFLKAAGYRVFLPAAETVVPDTRDWYDGEFTIWQASNDYGFEAVQLEISPTYRANSVLGRELARAIAGALSRLGR